jgi:hypothetical protein
VKGLHESAVVSRLIGDGALVLYRAAHAVLVRTLACFSQLDHDGGKNLRLMARSTIILGGVGRDSGGGSGEVKIDITWPGGYTKCRATRINNNQQV